MPTKAMRLLLIEDETLLAAQVDRFLRDHGFVVDMAADGEEGLHLAREFRYVAALVDLGLPKLDGLSLVQALRREGIATPVLILTARGTVQDVVTGLEAGADDYLAKPFDMAELLARLHALVRRADGHAATLIRYGPVELDPSRQRVRVDGAAVELTAFEYRVLEYLAMKAGRVVSKAELVDQIYQQDFDRDSNTIEVFVGRLRRKLDPERRLDLIHTVRGQGYRFGQ